MKSKISKFYAQLWQWLYQAQYRVSGWQPYHIQLTAAAMLLIFIAASFWVSPQLQDALSPYFSNQTQNNLSNLRSLLLNVGSAMIGASAIAFSLVVFAMQVNVERMPHGLFRRFSTDFRVIASFAGTFLIAIAIACSSLIPDASWAAIAVIGATWGVILVFILFLNAYRRALVLINPLQQLKLIVNDACRNLQSWIKRTRRITPLLKGIEPEEPTEGNSRRSTHDMARITYLSLHPHWTVQAQLAISHAMSYALRFAEQGDHEVSYEALKSVVAINHSYVKAKGKTFFAQVFMVDNPLVNDGFINNTLELLRQHLRSGITRGDEQHIEQTLQAMEMLVGVYVQIDYSNENATKTHALLAAGYLSEGVKSVVLHDMPDVLMEGVRLMGKSAHLLLSCDEPNSVVATAENIALLACTGCANEKYRPVTLTAFEQLAKLTFDLIRTSSHYIHYAIKQLREDITMVVKLFLKVPDTPLQRIHSTFLAPYFSVTATQAFLAWQRELINALSDAKQDDDAAKKIVSNFACWSKQLYISQKELLLLAVEKRSGFTFDIIHWIASVTKMLLALSNAQVCDDHIRDELWKDALWLIYVIDWIPGDEETVKFIESYQPVTVLFEAAMDAHSRECPDMAVEIQKIVVNWAFKAGKFQTGWATLEQSIYALVTLVLTKGGQQHFDVLKQQLTTRFSQEPAISQEIRDCTARDIRRKSETLYNLKFETRSVEYQMNRLDQNMLRDSLVEIANILSPGTSNEPGGKERVAH
ncbi:MAG: hypothetical protein HS132_16065 [Planctomycetia bacterium]|nr:hypothetical protein [Planctomycetia bacterium]